MADASAVLSALRQELVDGALVRPPSVAGILAPMHIQPVEGPPAPGERKAPEDDPGLVLSIFEGGRYAEGPFDAVVRARFNIDLRSRAKTNGDLRRAMALEAAIVGRLIRPATNYGYGFTLAAGGTAPLFCQEAAAAGGGPVSSGRGVGFDRVLKIMLEVAP